MHIISHKTLRDFYEIPGNEDSKVSLERWYNNVKKAKWENLADIKKDYSSADYVGNQHYVFNIKGNKYRLIVVVVFTPGLVYIRWVGPHKDYDKIDCANI